MIATFADKYAAKYDKSVTCLVKDRDALLTVSDFPTICKYWDALVMHPPRAMTATMVPQASEYARPAMH